MEVLVRNCHRILLTTLLTTIWKLMTLNLVDSFVLKSDQPFSWRFAQEETNISFLIDNDFIISNSIQLDTAYNLTMLTSMHKCSFVNLYLDNNERVASPVLCTHNSIRFLISETNGFGWSHIAFQSLSADGSNSSQVEGNGDVVVDGIVLQPVHLVLIGLGLILIFFVAFLIRKRCHGTTRKKQKKQTLLNRADNEKKLDELSRNETTFGSMTNEEKLYQYERVFKS
jgi:hypothetical protein